MVDELVLPRIELYLLIVSLCHVGRAVEESLNEVTSELTYAKAKG